MQIANVGRCGEALTVTRCELLRRTMQIAMPSKIQARTLLIGARIFLLAVKLERFLLISLVSGAVGGNAAGKVLKNFDMGTLWNSVAGIVGGGLGG
jgi:hypothetical protein